MQTVGEHQTSPIDIFSHMDTSHRGQHPESYQRLQQKHTRPAVRTATLTIEAKCVEKVKEIYDEFGGQPRNIDVIYDGTWLT